MGIAEFHIPDITPVLRYDSTFCVIKHIQILFDSRKRWSCPLPSGS